MLPIIYHCFSAALSAKPKFKVDSFGNSPVEKILAGSVIFVVGD